MTSGFSVVFFLIFCLILIWVYMAIRRQWAAPGFVAAVGIIGTVISMLLMSVSQGNVALHAIVVGIVLGVLFTGATIAVARYFNLKQGYARQVQPHSGDSGG
ncbi:MAG: hypothetical protein IT320_24665 [Anaerolineae bacterium]|nr:hypothetical protein [Anaerolineae bacterium]